MVNYATKPGNDKGRKEKTEHDTKKVGYYDWRLHIDDKSNLIREV